LDELDFMPELAAAALKFKAVIKDEINSSMPPPNAPSTVKRKGHDRTLIDSKALLESINIVPFAEKDEIGFDIGVFDPDVLEYAELNHDGTRFIPARPFISKPVDENEERISLELDDAINAKILAFFDS
jgi:hypothetical protein